MPNTETELTVPLPSSPNIAAAVCAFESSLGAEIRGGEEYFVLYSQSARPNLIPFTISVRGREECGERIRSWIRANRIILEQQQR